MSELQIKIPIWSHREDLAKRAIEVSRKIEFDWEFYGNKVRFRSSAEYNKKLSSDYLYDLNRFQEWLKHDPSNERIREHYLNLQKDEHKRWEYDAIISFAAEIPIEIDNENNGVFYYTGSPAVEITNRNRKNLKASISSDRLDEFYDEKVRKCVLAIIMAYILTWPDVELGSARVEILFNGKQYHTDSYIAYPLHTDSYRYYKNIITTSLDFDQTMNWIKCNTSLFGKMKKSPVAFSALTYVLNRETHESLLYSIIGLESIFTPKSKGITFALQNRINHVFPMVTKEKIKTLYQARSKFVHGEMKVGNYHLSDEVTADYLEMDEPATLATAILLESIRLLIKANSTSIKFTESITHHFN